jgi:hypothetical protein
VLFGQNRSGAQSRNELTGDKDESDIICEEALPEVQNRQTARQRVRYLRKPEAQAEAGLRILRSWHGENSRR